VLEYWGKARKKSNRAQDGESVSRECA